MTHMAERVGHAVDPAEASAIATGASVFIPDVMLRSQYFEMVGTHSLSGEQRLMLAVLADAINVVQQFDSSRVRSCDSFGDAWDWFFIKGGRSPLSFDNVCEALGIDADRLRRRLSEFVAERGGSALRLRLKEGSRMQCLTVNQMGRRDPGKMHRAASFQRIQI